MANYYNGGYGSKYEDLGSMKLTAVAKESKNGKKYWSVVISDKKTHHTYNVMLFSGDGSTYVPKNSKKSYRNGKTCCPVIVNVSQYNGKSQGLN